MPGEPPTIGVVSPGAMGSALGKAWQRGGARVIATTAGRSERTRSLAEGLELLPGLGDVVDAADIIVSVGPPDRAALMATAIADACRVRDRRPLVADLNAIAPTTVARIAVTISRAGCEFLDGSISGAPPTPLTSTLLHLSGSSAQRLADLPAPGLTSRVVGTRIGAASAVKMCTAGVYKGFTALLVQALQTARANGVTDFVLADLREDFGGLLEGAAPRIASAAAKSGRYPGEMREIAMAQGEAGAQPAVFEAIAQVFEALAKTPLAAQSPEDAEQASDLDSVLSQLSRAEYAAR